MSDQVLRRAIAALRVGATSLLLTMSVFSEQPRGRVRPTYAIERTLDGEADEQFDPREVIGGNVVLTLPLDAAQPSGAPRSTVLSRN
ncbi:MAG TPA: hypothetical protein VFL82_12950 [Thermomicrobiales bacterium]|nr:hypothetical protein [Thermomicrobiales bacterium]